MLVKTKFLICALILFIGVFPVQAQFVYVSDLNWTSAEVGWGTPHEDKDVSGKPLEIRDVVYENGVGVHANSEIVYNLQKKYDKFTAVIGIDSSMTSVASSIFIVKGDDKVLFESPVLNVSSEAINVEVSVLGVEELKLVTTDGGDGIGGDMNNWADAKLSIPSAEMQASIKKANALKAARVAKQEKLHDEKMYKMVEEIIKSEHEVGKYPSKTPRYTFSKNLIEQEKQLKNNPLLLRFAASREKHASTPYRPAYHFVSPEYMLNDPNGLCFWQGKWHLFYQGYPADEFPDAKDIKKRRQHWGHAVSDDLVHWRDLPYALYPGIERMCFSGGTLVEKNFVAAYYLGVAAGQMIAFSDDPLLLNWKQKLCNSRAGDGDIWKEGDTYYGLLGRFNLNSSKDLLTWNNEGPLIGGNQHLDALSEDANCPNFLAIGNKHIWLGFSHKKGGQYLLGDYDKKTHKFIPYSHGRFNHGLVAPGGVHAPSAASDGKGGVINILNINDGRQTDSWDQIMSLPQQLTLDTKNDLSIQPVKAIETLRAKHESVGTRKLPANQEIVFDNIKGNAMEIDLEIDPQNAKWIRLNVLRSPDSQEKTSITFYNHDRVLTYWYSIPGEIVLDGTHSSILSDVDIRPPERCIFQRKGEPLKLRVFIDRSVVEVYVNSRKYLAMRVYPGRKDSLGVSLQARGQDALLKRMDAWQMKAIWPVDSTRKEAAQN